MRSPLEVEVVAGVSGRAEGTRLIVGGVDLTAHVRHFAINADVDEATTLILELNFINVNYKMAAENEALRKQVARVPKPNTRRKTRD